jgi:hypothetical protein
MAIRLKKITKWLSIFESQLSGQHAMGRGVWVFYSGRTARVPPSGSVTCRLQDPATTVVIVPGRPVSLIMVAAPFAQSTSIFMPGRAPAPWR